MKRSAPPAPLRASPKVLEEWAHMVQVAANFEKRHIPTVSVDIRVIVAIDQELRILRSSNEFLRARRGEEAAAQGEEADGR